MRLVLLGCVLFVLGGCSWLVNDHDNDYLKSQIQPNITIPKDVALLELKPQFPIPEVASVKLADEFVVPRPRPLVVKEEVETVSLVDDSAVKLETDLLKDGNGTPILRLNVEFPRAWARLGEALNKADVSVSDLNRSIGTYYVELPDESAEKVEPGFWASLFGSKPEVVMVALQVKLNRARSGVYIAIHKDFDNLAEDALAESLLERIQKNI